MKKLISDKELIRFTSGQLSQQETKEVYKKSLANGETDMLLHVQLASLELQKELADELLGEDDFMQDSEDNYRQWQIAAKDYFQDKNNK